MAVLGLCCYPQAFSSCGEWELLFSCHMWASHCLASVVVEHRLLGALSSMLVVCGFSCPSVCGIFPDLGLNLCPLYWQADA